MERPLGSIESDILVKKDIAEILSGLDPNKYYFLSEQAGQDALPKELLQYLFSEQNLNKYLRERLPVSRYGFGYHVGGLEHAGSDVEKTSILLPSQDKGYGFGVFADPFLPQVKYAGGMKYGEKLRNIPIYLMPFTNDTYFKLDSGKSGSEEFKSKSGKKSTLVACIPKMVLMEDLSIDTIPIMSESGVINSELEGEFGIPEKAIRELLAKYQRHATHIQVLWARKYFEADVSPNEISELRKENMSTDEIKGLYRWSMMTE